MMKSSEDVLFAG